MRDGLLGRLSPDVPSTVRRFALAVGLDALATIVLLGSMNSWFGPPSETVSRLFLGLGTGAVLAVAGVYFRESRPGRAGWLTGLVAYGLPILAIGLFQVTDTHWLIPFGLPAIALLWLSIAGFTHIGRGGERQEMQSRFWWLNFEAIATGAVTGIALLVVMLGVLAIERSLSVLFGIETGDVFYKILLPAIAAFCAPVYWLSTLPRLDEYDPARLAVPDFLGRATGFVAQFALVPLLLAYALILIAYAVQIALAWHVPGGMIGWMVLGFTVAGAAAVLALYPPFLRDHLLSRLFLRWWFWLTLLPLGLYALAVFIRIDAYGLTTERMLLVAGGVWAAALAGFSLTRHGDIRLVPGLAMLALTVISLGPWNAVNLPLWDQERRLDALLEQGHVTSRDSKPTWTLAQGDAAMGALIYLYGNEQRRERLIRVLAKYGIAYQPGADDPWTLFKTLDSPPQGLDFGDKTLHPTRAAQDQFVDVSATPVFVGTVSILGDQAATLADLDFTIAGAQLVIEPKGGAAVRVDLTDWIARQPDERIADPSIGFALAGRDYALVLDAASIDIQVDPDGARRRLTFLSGALFAAASP